MDQAAYRAKVRGQALSDVCTAVVAYQGGMREVVEELSGPWSFIAAIGLLDAMFDELRAHGGDPAAFMARAGYLADAIMAA